MGALVELLVPLGILHIIGCIALGGWLASEKGYSVGSWVVLFLLFGVVALIVLVGAPDKKSQIIMKEQSKLLDNISAPDDWVCVKCGKNNRKTALFCTVCGEKK